MGRVNRNFFVFVCVVGWGMGGVTIHRNSRMVVSKKGKVFRLRAISIIFFFNEKKKEEYGEEEYCEEDERSSFKFEKEVISFILLPIGDRLTVS